MAYLISIIPSESVAKATQALYANKHSYKPVPFILFWCICVFYYYYSYTDLLKLTWKWMSLKIRLPGWWPQISSLNMSNNGWIMSFQRAQTWEAETYKQLNDDRHMTYPAYPHIRTHLSRHIHSISTKPSGFHCNPLYVPHCSKRKRLKLSTCSSVEVFLSEGSAVTWLCLSHWSPSHLMFSLSFSYSSSHTIFFSLSLPQFLVV